MDVFEQIVARLMEEQGYWVRQGVRANLSKAQKESLGNPTMPRPQVDLVGYSPKQRELVFLEVKSFLDSRGVTLKGLKHWYQSRPNRYKLLNVAQYQGVVTKTILREYRRAGLVTGRILIRVGLAAGNVPQSERAPVRTFAQDQGWYYLGPDQIAEGIRRLSRGPYEESAAILTAKLLRQNPEGV